MFAYDPKTFTVKDGRVSCSDPAIRLLHGVDVSAHQGEIDWKAVKADGIDFAILRAAYRGYGTGRLNPDQYFQRNLQEAAAAGLKVGVYVFSQAVSVEEALEEAQFALEAIEGKEVTGPVVFDWEAIPNDTARTDGMTTDVLCACAKAFCRRVAEAGYQPMVYFNGYEDYCKYDMTQLAGFGIWFAQYQTQPVFYCDFNLWQYTISGSVAGISGNVDRDVWFYRE